MFDTGGKKENGKQMKRGRIKRGIQGDTYDGGEMKESAQLRTPSVSLLRRGGAQIFNHRTPKTQGQRGRTKDGKRSSERGGRGDQRTQPKKV